jgi:hypothetical protein
MSISQHELHVLESIGNQLTASDPELAGLMAIFTRLTVGEKMPASEHIRVSWRWAARISRRIKRHRRHQARKPRGRRRLARQTRTMLVIWLLITASLISAAVALGGASGQNSCAMAWAIGCSQSAPAHSPRPGTS